MTDNELINVQEEALRVAKETINRQKAEIEKKDTEIDILIRKKETLKDELAERQAEIEELKKYKHDYYVLQSITRKEFAERLKEKSKKRVSDIYGKRIFIEDIDNLLAEMESERE